MAGPQLGADRLESSGVDIGGRYSRALAGAAQRDRPADASRAAGDDRGPPRQFHDGLPELSNELNIQIISAD